MNQSKISIITVCYNCKADLERTILSIKEQSYKNIELIIIDGGSSDGTQDLLIHYSAFITSYVSEPDKGIYDAMNKGISLCSGDWVSFMNAGDEFANNQVLEHVFSEKEYTKDIKVLYGDIKLYFPGLGLISRDYSKYTQEEIAIVICHQSSFIEGDIIRSLKYDLKYKIASDINTFYKIYKEGWRFQYLNMDIAKFEAVGGVSSKKMIALSSEIYDITGRSKFTLGWVKCWIKGFVKQQMMRIMGDERYARCQYKRLLNKYREFQ